MDTQTKAPFKRPFQVNAGISRAVLTLTILCGAAGFVATSGAVTAQAQTVATYSLSGSVTDARGVPVPQVNLALSSRGRVVKATTDVGGHYAFRGLEGGSYTISVLAGPSTTSTSKHLHLGAANPSAAVDLQVSSIVGHVTDKSGLPLAGATLALAFEGSPVAQALTDNNGAYSFLRLGGGVYTVSGVDGNGIAFVTSSQSLRLGSQARVVQQDFVARRLASQIVFVSERDGNREVYAMGEDGSNQTNLTNNAAQDDEASISPDGSKIVFTSYRDSDPEIWVMNSDGSGQLKLTNNTAQDFFTSWSPDSKRIAFCSNFGVCVINVDGSGLQKLTEGTYTGGPADVSPMWSPNGQQIAFRRGDHIFCINSDGSGLTQLTTEGTNGIPVWSPDGSQIAFVSNRRNQSPYDKIFVMNADGSGQTLLSTGLSNDVTPVWSPDGKQLAFTCYDSQGSNLQVINADGTNQRMLLRGSVYRENQFGLAWKADSSAIILALDVSPADAPYSVNSDLFTVSLDSGALTRLTTSGQEKNPVWFTASPR